MKGEFALKILEKLSGAAVEAADLFEAFLMSGYGASRSKIEYNLRQISRRRERKAKEKEEYFRLQRRYHNTLAWLKADGLIIDKKMEEGGRIFMITRRGLAKLNELENRKAERLPVKSYIAKESNNVTIFAFDIPEKERRKRDWLRDVLKNLGLTMLQKSVWIGKVQIPKTLIDDISKLRLGEFVEIFEVTKKGSLRHII